MIKAKGIKLDDVEVKIWDTNGDDFYEIETALAEDIEGPMTVEIHAALPDMKIDTGWRG